MRDASRDSELRFRTLFEQAPFSVQLLALDGRTLQINKAWETLWQIEGNDGLKEYVLNEYNILADPQLQEKGVTPYLRRAFAGESVTIPPICYDPADLGKPGVARWVKATAHPIKDGQEQVVEVMLIHEDISERMSTEKALRDSEEWLQEGLAVGRMVVWEWDLNTQKIEYSPNASEVMGYDASDVADAWKHVHRDDVERLSAAFNRAIEERGSFHELTRRIRPDNGKIVWMDNRGKVVLDDQGNPSSIRAINMDVTERIQAELELKEANRRKDEFLAMLAHELRNPLAPISTAAQILKIPGADEKVKRQASEIISRQVQHMTNLVDDLLDVSRVTRGLVNLEKADLDLKTVISNAVEQIRPLIEARHHVLTTWMDADHITVHGDQTRLVQVIVNLLNNAAKYTPQGGELALRVEAQHGQVSISIKDNGIGIDASLLPHVFELFTQAIRTPDRSQGGLGIGLALVKNIVTLHHGQVKAQSDGLGKGSTFTVTLPLAKADAVQATQQGNTSLSKAVKPVRVMVVDDNQDAAQSLAVLLKMEGHQVIAEENSASALANAEKNPPDVFILDIGMPDMSGHELAQRLRASPKTANALIIALTGYGQVHDIVQSKAAGFDHHLVKPTDMEELKKIIGQAAGASTC